MSGKLKLTFGEPPKTFKKDVECTLLDGSVIKFKMTFITRTRTEYGQMLDELNAAGDKKLPAGVTMQQVYAMGGAEDANSIKKMAESWDLEDPFTEENLKSISDKHPMVVFAISEAYRDAVVNGRIKN